MEAPKLVTQVDMGANVTLNLTLNSKYHGASNIALYITCIHALNVIMKAVTMCLLGFTGQRLHVSVMCLQGVHVLATPTDDTTGPQESGNSVASTTMVSE